jgi:hypothetical protein
MYLENAIFEKGLSSLTPEQSKEFHVEVLESSYSRAFCALNKIDYSNSDINKVKRIVLDYYLSKKIS